LSQEQLQDVRFHLLEFEQECHEVFGDEIEVVESYFGGKRKGQRGHGAAGKVYTKIIPDTSAATLFPIIEGQVIPDSIAYCDYSRGYNVLDVSDLSA
jgi:transposase